jgi:hypothetical protein
MFTRRTIKRNIRLRKTKHWQAGQLENLEHAAPIKINKTNPNANIHANAS